MIPVLWVSGHFRYSLIADGRQHLDLLASVAGAATTVLVAAMAGPVYGAVGGAAAVLSAGVVNACASGMAMFRVTGSVRLGVLMPGVLTAAVALGAGLVLLDRAGWVAGAAAACVTLCGRCRSKAEPPSGSRRLGRTFVTTTPYSECPGRADFCLLWVVPHRPRLPAASRDYAPSPARSGRQWS
jgi:hypothetical protein